MPRALKPKPYRVYDPYRVVCYGGEAHMIRSTEKQAREAAKAMDKNVCWSRGCRDAVARGYRHRVVRLDAVDLPYEAPKAAKREEAGDGE